MIAKLAPVIAALLAGACASPALADQLVDNVEAFVAGKPQNVVEA